MAGSFPFLPQRLIVKGETRRRSATSLIVKRSGKSESDTLEDGLNLFGMVCIIKAQNINVKCQGLNHYIYLLELYIFGLQLL